jgi:DNA-binding response OmpR family regulator
MATYLHKSNDRADTPQMCQTAADGKPLVLVVEDHDDTRFMLEYLLGMRGCRVVVASDGEMAVHVAESEHPDLILMDATLPRLDGLAGHAHASFRNVALETGGNDFLAKPFELDQLERVLERHLGQKRH